MYNYVCASVKYLIISNCTKVPVVSLSNMSSKYFFFLYHTDNKVYTIYAHAYILIYKYTHICIYVYLFDHWLIRWS